MKTLTVTNTADKGKGFSARDNQQGLNQEMRLFLPLVWLTKQSILIGLGLILTRI